MIEFRGISFHFAAKLYVAFFSFSVNFYKLFIDILYLGTKILLVSDFWELKTRKLGLDKFDKKGTGTSAGASTSMSTPGLRLHFQGQHVSCTWALLPLLSYPNFDVQVQTLSVNMCSHTLLIMQQCTGGGGQWHTSTHIISSRRNCYRNTI